MQKKFERFHSIASNTNKGPESATPDDYYDSTKEGQLKGLLGKCEGVLHVLRGAKTFKLTFYGLNGNAVKLDAVPLLKLQEGLHSKTIVTNAGKFRIKNTQPLEVLLNGN